MGDDRQVIAISGATGLLGRALEVRLKATQNRVERLVRRRDFDGIYWNLEDEKIQAHRLEGMRAVFHLAGENIGGGRWTHERRARIRESRVKGTRLVANALAGLTEKPEVFLCASAVGYYGDAGVREMDESMPMGEGFLAGVCRHWEQACAPAVAAGIRVVHLRFGMLLNEKGGALQKMLPAFRSCVGGRFGNGEQFVSWIMLEDAVSACIHAMEHPEIKGPINVTTPDSVTNAEFTRTLAEALSRPAFCHVPAFVLRLMMGEELADELLLSGQRAVPRVLKEAGFTYRYPHLEAAFAAIAGRL